MNNLIRFFKKNFHIILFLILQIICFILISNSLNYPGFKIGKVERYFTYPLNKMWGNVLQHFNYKAENRSLVEQNLSLLREQEANFLLLSDSLYIKEAQEEKGWVRLYDYMSANVIYNTIHKAHNYMIIDKGVKDGMTLDMAVFSAQGVVGIVNDVSENFSTVMSILHPDARISAKLMPSNQLGTVMWEGKEPDEVYLYDIPQHVTVNIGDSVFTSGFSNVFPRDLLIGEVIEVQLSQNASFYVIKLRLATDMNRVNSVFVVKNLYKEELDQLKSNFKNE